MNSPTPRRGLTALLAALLFLVTCAAFSSVSGNDFVNYDDTAYVTHNDVVLDGLTPRGVAWAFQSDARTGNWHPLTWLSHMLDIELFGRDAAGHHGTSVALHALNAVLLLLFLAWTTGRPVPSAIAAALFALHPLRVESVAWVAERKDVLSGTFFLLTLLAYARWVRVRGNGGRGTYALVAVALALGLMAKQMLVTVPAVLLLVDLWPLRRWRGLADPAPDARSFAALVREKLPLFAVAVAAAGVAFVAQRAGGTVGTFAALPLDVRLINAVAAYGSYLWLTLWPGQLAYFYPHPALVPDDPWETLYRPALISGVVLVAASALVLRGLRRAPWLAVGWLWFLGMLVPVIGLVQIGSQSHADRYTYLPLIGIVLAVVYGAEAATRASPVTRRALAGAAVGALALLAALTWRQTGVWRDSETLSNHTIANTRHNYIAYNNLGLVHLQRDELDRAEELFRRSLAINPGLHVSRFNLGLTLERQGRTDEARAEYERLLERHAGDAAALARLADLREREGDLAGAIESLTAALRANPGDLDGWLRLGWLHLGAGDRAAAEEAAEAALERARESGRGLVRAHVLRGVVCQEHGERMLALEHFRQALEIDPNDGAALTRLGRLFAQAGELEEARAHFERAAALDPGAVDARVGLAKLHLVAGETQAAVERLDQALEIDPDDPEANDARGFLLLQERRLDEAEACFLRALERDPSRAGSRNNLGFLYETGGDPARAAEQYALVLAGDLEDPIARVAARGLAWILATSEDAALRDGAEAVRWATFALDAGDAGDPVAWETLAAARAEAGQFAEAVEAQDRAIELTGDSPRLERMRRRRAQYEAEIPLRRTP